MADPIDDKRERDQGLAGRPASRNALVLGSASSARSRILRNAGVDFLACESGVDEAPIRKALISRGESVEFGALALARAKAFAVADRMRDSYVIGADQILEYRNQWFEKPASRCDAIRQLRTLSGQSHRLVCGVVAVRNGCELWQYGEQAVLAVRPLSDSFITEYLEQAGDQVLQSVGCYQIEGVGAQLFSSINGDYFTIMGLPLFPVLGFLRIHGFLGS